MELPDTLTEWLSEKGRRWLQFPRVGWVSLEDFHRTKPFDNRRGTTIDDYYINQFLSRHSRDVRGRVLAAGGGECLQRFTAGDRVSESVRLPDDGLTVFAGSPPAAGDEAKADNSFDCLVLPHCLHRQFELAAAAKTVFRLLRPGGVVLATVPGFNRLEANDDADCCWGLTSMSLQRLFTGDAGFLAAEVELETYGNVLTATAFLYGLAAEELTEQELLYKDPEYQLLIGVRAQKPVA